MHSYAGRRQEKKKEGGRHMRGRLQLPLPVTAMDIWTEVGR